MSEGMKTTRTPSVKGRSRAKKRAPEQDINTTAAVVVVIPRAQQAEDEGGDTGATLPNATLSAQPDEIPWVGPGIGLPKNPPASRGAFAEPRAGDFYLGAARLAAQVAN